MNILISRVFLQFSHIIYLGAASGGGPIKIQAIQTNPNTGAKQIVAIPIHRYNLKQV